MPLKLGKWKMNLNGTEADLVLQAVNDQGVATGYLIDQGILGFWNEVIQTLSFVTQRSIQGGELIPMGIFFKGYLFSTPPLPQSGQDILWTLAGFVADASGEIFPGLAAPSKRRNEFGWFAQINDVV
jgi:hypothetical protein